MKYLLEYFYKNTKCTDIIADYSAKTVTITNYVDNPILRAFGVRECPNWEEYNQFLEDRCIPRTRDGLRYYLESLGLYEYDPFEIVKKTNGRMAEDNWWLTVTQI